MNDLIRPSLYDSYHRIQSVVRRNSGEIEADVVGPICESGDYLAKKRKIPVFQSGDLVAVMRAGAYGFTMSCNYNSRPRVAEVMVEGDRFHIVRERETYADLVKGERIPSFLSSGGSAECEEQRKRTT
jgi:diaminopimelate decarboxylase